MCEKLTKKEHLKRAEKLGDREYFSLRGAKNDKRFVKNEKEIQILKEKLELLENNHLSHLGEEVYRLGKFVKDLEEKLNGK